MNKIRKLQPVGSTSVECKWHKDCKLTRGQPDKECKHGGLLCKKSCYKCKKYCFEPALNQTEHDHEILVNTILETKNNELASYKKRVMELFKDHDWNMFEPNKNLIMKHIKYVLNKEII